ncbi:MAG: alanine racemase [Elusimicrobia bacterium GWC2_51_8]|nr:MAG: alanine racemase [Elusimicrobia bacterium GWA2_51_34]OGR57592.1 MAG: alanine racemase [Elusimicrobia bacterium GWC2_51_8]HAF95742.1 alanine racemase [Elusimicrobiota bacterium]HCE97237.1 alanine racemase [Elusimicrobiota bacterium]
MKVHRPTTAEISLPALEANLHKIKKTVGDKTRLMFVVKADAYGHGAAAAAVFAEKEKLAWGYGVSSVEEGLALRRAGIKSPVLVLGSLYPFESFVEAIHADLALTISSLEAACQAVSASKRLGKKAWCHVKLETGMGRIGARKPSVIKIFKELGASKTAAAAGLYTHLSSSDSDPQFSARQLEYFRQTVIELEKSGTRALIKHTANSFAALNYPQSRWDMVRVGLAAYGCMEGFQAALTLKTRIVFIKTVREGAYISYNKSFRVRGPMKIATLPIGYGDGYTRALSNKAEVLVGGRRCRVVGNITMDMLMIDVTGVKEAAVGDEAVLIGRQGREEITARELALKALTIPYEITTLITARVPRVYVG